MATREEEVIDLANAEAQLNAMIERRTREAEGARSRGEPDPVEEMWEASVRRDNERRRRALRAEWHAFYSRLADAHARLSERFEERALALLEEDPRKETEREAE